MVYEYKEPRNSFFPPRTKGKPVILILRACHTLSDYQTWYKARRWRTEEYNFSTY